MRPADIEMLDHIDGGTEPAWMAGGNGRRGLCRLGEAVQELLASYPISIEIVATSPDEYRPIINTPAETFGSYRDAAEQRLDWLAVIE